MKKVTSLELANKIIIELVSMIEYEYGYAEYAHQEYARDRANFDKYDDKDRQYNYLLWSGGQLEAMTNLKAKMDDLFEEVFQTVVNGEHALEEEL